MDKNELRLLPCLKASHRLSKPILAALRGLTVQSEMLRVYEITSVTAFMTMRRKKLSTKLFLN